MWQLFLSFSNKKEEGLKYCQMLCKLISIVPIFARVNQSKDLMRCFHWPIRIKSKSTKRERKRLTKSHEIEFNYEKLNIRQKTSIRKKLPHRKKITFTFTLLSITLIYLSSFTFKFTVCAHCQCSFPTITCPQLLLTLLPFFIPDNTSVWDWIIFSLTA